MEGAGIAGAVTGGLATIGKGIMSGIQMNNGKKELKALEANKPFYQRPDEITELGNISAMSYLDKEMPGQRLAEENILAGTANNLQAIKEMGGLSDIAGVQKTQYDAFNSLATAGANAQMSDELNYLNTLGTLGAYSDQEFNYNVNLPYQEKKAMAMDKISQGKQGLWGMMGDLQNMGASLIGLQGGKSGVTGGAQGAGGGQTQAQEKFDSYYGIARQGNPTDTTNFTGDQEINLPSSSWWK